MQTQTCIEVKNEWGIVAARQAGRTLSKEIGFGTVDQARITTAISELARNIYLYASPGEVRIDVVEQIMNNGLKKGIQITAKDYGPGIPDIRQVMIDGYTTSGGMGAGLPGVKRLMDDMEIDSKEDQGTTIIARKWLR